MYAILDSWWLVENLRSKNLLSRMSQTLLLMSESNYNNYMMCISVYFTACLSLHRFSFHILFALNLCWIIIWMVFFLYTVCYSRYMFVHRGGCEGFVALPDLHLLRHAAGCDWSVWAALYSLHVHWRFDDSRDNTELIENWLSDVLIFI